jgi:hypothetical protein
MLKVMGRSISVEASPSNEVAFFQKIKPCCDVPKKVALFCESFHTFNAVLTYF